MSDQSKAAKELATIFIDDDPWASQKSEIEKLKLLLKECLESEYSLLAHGIKLRKKIKEALK
jgi:hypothetical protein